MGRSNDDVDCDEDVGERVGDDDGVSDGASGRMGLRFLHCVRPCVVL